MSGMVSCPSLSDSKQDKVLDVSGKSWKIMLVDDDPHSHRMIKLFLKNLDFCEKPLEFVSAYSGAEAISLIQAHPDTAVILLDVVMEELDSGLQVADYIRNDAGNKLMRIVMLTGQANKEKEQEVIFKYDINDYKIKTEFSRQKLVTTILASLRSYRDLITIEAHRNELVELSTRLAARTAELEQVNKQLEQQIIERETVEKELLEKHNLLQTVIDNVPDFIFVKDANSCFVVNNAAHLRALGAQSQDEVSGQTDFDIFSPGLATSYFADEQSIIQSGRPLLNRIEPYVGADTEEKRWLSTTKIPLRDSRGKIVGLVGRSRDITAQMETEAALRRYEFIVNTSQELMTLIDGQHTYAAVSTAFCKALNKSPREVLGLSVADIWGKERYQKRIKKNLERCFSGEQVQYEQWIQFAGLGRRCIDVTYYPYGSHTDEITHVVVVSRDITQHKQAKEALFLANTEKEQLLTAISSILIGVDDNGNITHWNKPAEVAFGIASSEVTGKLLAKCNVQWNWTSINGGLAACKEKSQPVDLRNVQYTRAGDNKEAFLEVAINPFNNGESILLLAQDISRRKILESQLAQAQKLEAVGQLAAGIAHEINSPTQYIGDNVGFIKTSFGKLERIIRQYQRLLQAEKEDAVTPQMISEIEDVARAVKLTYLLEEIPLAAEEAMDGVSRVSKIVTAMKDFSHPGVEEKTSIHINKAIRSTIAVARGEWKHVAEVKTDLAPNLPLIMGLPGELNQAFLNILINAAHAIGDVVGDGFAGKGQITVSTQCDGSWLEIRIGDTGPGIAEDIRQKIFDPFFTTKEVGKGTGQGLAIAYAVIVEQHNGTLTVESKVGQGTTFIIHLPIDPVTSARELTHV